MITLGYLCGNFWKAYCWDWLMCLSDEYQIYQRSGMTLPNVAYILSRWVRQRNTILNITRGAKCCLSVGSLGFCTSCAVWAVAPVAHCQVLEYVMCSFYELSLPATSALFFFRVKAVYRDSKVVTLFFGALWLSVPIFSILLMLAVKSSEYIYVLDWISDNLHITHRSYTVHDALSRVHRQRLRFSTHDYHRRIRYTRVPRHLLASNILHGRRVYMASSK